MVKVTDPGRVTNAPTKLKDATAYRVSLRDNKPLVIRADSNWEAVEKYKRKCGIIVTENKFEVEAADDTDAIDVDLRDVTLPPLTGFNEAMPNPKEQSVGVFGI